MTPLQPEASAKEPWTSTTVGFASPTRAPAVVGAEGTASVMRVMRTARAPISRGMRRVITFSFVNGSRLANSRSGPRRPSQLDRRAGVPVRPFEGVVGHRFPAGRAGREVGAPGKLLVINHGPRLGEELGGRPAQGCWDR